MTDPNRLLDRYLDDQLVAEELEQLEQDLSSNTKYADAFAKAMMIDALLKGRFEHESLAKTMQLRDGSFLGEDDLRVLQDDYDHAEADTVTLIELKSKHTRDNGTSASEALAVLSFEFKQLVRSNPKPFILSAVGAVAAVLLIALTLSFVFSDAQDDQVADPFADVPLWDTPAPKHLPVVALLTDAVGAQWRSDDKPVPMPMGAQLVAFERYTLTHGFAEITTRRGAKALLQAPCTIEFTENDNAIRLHQGKLVGNCETALSKGFTVHAPGMDVVDLGTRFGVAADSDGVSTVRVLEGSVRAQPTELSPHAFQPVVLGKDQARRVVPETGSLEMIAVSEAPVFHPDPVHPYVATVLDAKPLMWLRQNAQDPTRLHGDARFNLIGNEFGAVEIDGKGYVDAGDILDFEADQPFSFAIWIKPGANQDDAFVLGRIDKNRDQGIHGYDLYLKQRRLRFQITHRFEVEGVADAQIRVESSEQLAPEQWHHVAVTYDGSRSAAGVRFFINGVKVPTTVRDDVLGNNSIRAKTTFRLGIRGFAQPQPTVDLQSLDTAAIGKIGSPMVGSVGDLVVLDRPLSADEISLFHSHSGTVYSDE